MTGASPSPGPRQTPGSCTRRYFFPAAVRPAPVNVPTMPGSQERFPTGTRRHGHCPDGHAAKLTSLAQPSTTPVGCPPPQAAGCHQQLPGGMIPSLLCPLSPSLCPGCQHCKLLLQGWKAEVINHRRQFLKHDVSGRHPTPNNPPLGRPGWGCRMEAGVDVLGDPPSGPKTAMTARYAIHGAHPEIHACTYLIGKLHMARDRPVIRCF